MTTADVGKHRALEIHPEEYMRCSLLRKKVCPVFAEVQLDEQQLRTQWPDLEWADFDEEEIIASLSPPHQCLPTPDLASLSPPQCLPTPDLASLSPPHQCLPTPE